MLLLLVLVGSCFAVDKVLITLKLHTFHSGNSLPGIDAIAPNCLSSYVMKLHDIGNNTFKAKLSAPWPNNSTHLLFKINEESVYNSVHLQVKKGMTHAKFITDSYKLHITVLHIDEISQKEENGCGCVKGSCSCCETINIPRLEFTHTICANISYNPETIGLILALGVDGHYYVEEISVRNPPPICFDIPGVHEIVDLCLVFKNLNLTKKNLSGCMEIELKLIHMEIFHLPPLCFNMPISH